VSQKNWWQRQKNLWRLWAADACLFAGIPAFLNAAWWAIICVGVAAWGFFLWDCQHNRKNRGAAVSNVEELTAPPEEL
jgi:hypothetical protein